MKANSLGERSGLPSSHTSCYHCDQVNAATFDRGIATNRFETFAPEKLARSRNVLNAREPEIVSPFSFGERRPTHTEPWVFGKLGQKELEILCIEGNICVQVPDDGIRQMLHTLPSRIKGHDLAAKMPFATLGKS